MSSGVPTELNLLILNVISVKLPRVSDRVMVVYEDWAPLFCNGGANLFHTSALKSCD